MQSNGAAREPAVAHALAWGDRWRAITVESTAHAGTTFRRWLPAG